MAKTELRSIGTELRAEGDNYQLTGTAIKYGVLSADLGGFRERFAPGSLTRSLQSGSDVRMLWDHKSSSPLARTKNGTLQLIDTPQGLTFRAQLNPASPEHRSAFEAIKSGLVDSMSFGFVVEDDSFEEGREGGRSFVTRTVKQARLDEISPVCYPAYNASGSTSVAARAEHRSKLNYCATPTDVRAFTRQEANALIDSIHRQRADDLAVEIRSERCSTDSGKHCSGCDDPDCDGLSESDFDEEDQ